MRAIGSLSMRAATSGAAIAAALGGGMAFTLFFVCMIGQLVWVLRVMPETRGVPLEEMERTLGIELSEEDIAGSGPRAH